MTRLKRLLAVGATLGLLAAAPPVSAQSADDLITLDYTPQGDDIIVTRKIDPPPQTNEVRKQARAITDATNIFDEPLAMFQKKVCPGVSGLPTELALYVANRIRYNVERIGLKLAEGGACRTNLLVAFVVNGQSAVLGLKDKPDSLLTQVSKAERDRLFADPGPVHSWQVVSLRSRDGVMAGWDFDGQMQVVNTQSSNSLFLMNIRKDVEFSIVIIDIPAIDGMSGKQIADYATMRGLAKTRPVTGDSEYGTILNLFDPNSSAPDGLTAFDIGYLKNLYANAPNIAAASKLGTVKGAMRKEVAAAALKANSE